MSISCVIYETLIQYTNLLSVVSFRWDPLKCIHFTRNHQRTQYENNQAHWACKADSLAGKSDGKRISAKPSSRWEDSNGVLEICVMVESYSWLMIEYFAWLLRAQWGSCGSRKSGVFLQQPSARCGPGSSVGIATGYGLDGPEIESHWGEIFRTCPDRPSGPPSLLYNGYRFFPGGNERPGRDDDPSPPSSAVVMKG